MTLLAVDDVGKRYGGLVAVDGVSFELGAGEIFGVIGPNGAGKSTLLAMLAGATRPTRGSIRLEGVETTRWRPHRVCRRGIARTHQIPQPFSELSVRENVEIAARFGGSGAVTTGEILALCGLERRADDLSGALPHVEQRRLELARALATDPRIVLLDEVGAGLNDEELDDLAELIRTLAARGLALVVVEHIMALVMGVCERILVMETGCPIAIGSPAEVVNDPAVVTAYLGVE